MKPSESGLPLDESGAKGEILVVDDEANNLSLLSRTLEKRGYVARTASNGPQALAAAQNDPPDLILLDIMMPRMSGYQVCEQLKADERTQDIPVIFISALSETGDKIKAFAVGGVDYITKPFQFKEVMARVETHLSLRKLQQQLEERNTQLELQIAERQRAEQTLRTYADRLRIMHEIDQSILAARSPDTIAMAAIGRIRQLMACQRVLVVELTETGDIRKLAAESSGELPLQAQIDIYQEMFDKEPLQRGQVQGVEDLGQLSHPSPMQRALYDEGVRSYAVVPLHVQQDLIGSLHLEASRPRAFTMDHIDVAAEIAILLAVAIRQARLYERAQREISERRRAQEALRQRTLELEARNAELDAFAHTVAHDLKNPLTSLIGYSNLLEKRFDRMSEERLRHNIQVIKSNGRKMTNIVNELLLLASVREMQEIPLQALDMASLVAEAQKRLDYMIAEHEAEIVTPPDDAWPVVQGHGPWIEEVWTNYLSNAIKYGGQPPRIELGAELQPDGFVRFWVQDNGPGLTDEERRRLFTPFERLHQASATGHGLGLSIVKRIIERLGGRVGVESRGVSGGGSCFFFTLPGSIGTKPLKEQ